MRAPACTAGCQAGCMMPAGASRQLSFCLQAHVLSVIGPYLQGPACNCFGDVSMRLRSRWLHVACRERAATTLPGPMSWVRQLPLEVAP